MTADQMAELAASGRYWWMRRNGDVYATAERSGGAEGDLYLLDASPEWVAQWGGDWNHAVEVLTPLFPTLDNYREET